MNLTDGGEGASGFRHSTETKAFLKEIATGCRNPNYGKPRSEDAKKKIGKAQPRKKRPLTQKTKDKMRISHKKLWEGLSDDERGIRLRNLSRNHSKETREKISAALKGRVIPEEQLKKMRGLAKSDEHKKAISESKRGKPWSEARRNAQLNRKKK